MNYSPSNLKKVESLIREGGYELRYEKGNFNAGYCVVMDKKIILVNRYFTDDAKFQKLLDIFSTLHLERAQFTDPNSLKVWDKLQQSSSIPIPFEPSHE